MGTRGLQGLGGRPQGRGCLLLAVAGATSLVTLLLAVPVTVLAVLALVSQEQGGQVTETSGSEAQARQGPDDSRPSCLLPSSSSLLEIRDSGQSPHTPASRHPGSPSPDADAQSSQESYAWAATPPAVVSSPVPGFQQRPEAEPGTDLNPRVPAAHLIGTEGLALPQDGVYYLYCHVGYRGRAPPGGRARSVTLRSALFRAGGAYGRGAPELLLEGAETVTPTLDRAGYASLWYTSVGFGGLVQLRSGERVYVNISHPDMVDYRRGKTFFGAVMVG